MIKMKELPVNDRPIERLQLYGVEALSNEELLSILLKTGTSEASVKELAKEILGTIDRIQELRTMNVKQLTKIKGIGTIKASTILAALELGKRTLQKQETIQKEKIVHPKVVFDYYKDRFRESMQEQFYCLYLDEQKRVIKEQLLFLGTLNFSLVHPREIFKQAYQLSASSIICVHNHPTGNVEPSKQDTLITKQLVEIGTLLGIPVIDHIIIGRESYYSFLEKQRIEE